MYLRHLYLIILAIIFLISIPVSAQVANDSVAQKRSNDAALSTLKSEIIEDKFFMRPQVDGKVGVSLFSEDAYSGKTASNPINSYMSAYAMGNIYFSRDFFVSANLRFSGSSGDATVDNYFIDQGTAFFAELALRYDAENWSAYFGHTKVNYSLARDNAAGLWGGSFVNKEVGVDGMMVAGGAYNFQAGKFGNHALSASAFMVDTTFLSDTYGSSRNPTPLSIGGPANTGKFNNYAVALDGLKISYLPRFRYQIATVQMQTQSLQYSLNKSATGQVDSQYLGTEQRYSAAGMWDKVPLYKDLIVTPLVEFNRINNSGGINGYHKDYYIGSLLFGYKQWNLGMSAGVWTANWLNQSATLKKYLPSNAYTNDRYNQFQIALGYAFENGLRTTIGYKKENKYNNLNTQTIGVNLRYDLPFSF